MTTVPSSLPRSGFIEKPLGYGRVLKLSSCKKYPLGRKLKFFDFRAQASGKTDFTNSPAFGLMFLAILYSLCFLFYGLSFDFAVDMYVLT